MLHAALSARRSQIVELQEAHAPPQQYRKRDEDGNDSEDASRLAAGAGGGAGDSLNAGCTSVARSARNDADDSSSALRFVRRRGAVGDGRSLVPAFPVHRDDINAALMTQVQSTELRGCMARVCVGWWNAARATTGYRLHSLRSAGHAKAVVLLRPHRGRQMLASSGGDDRVWLWDLPLSVTGSCDAAPHACGSVATAPTNGKPRSSEQRVRHLAAVSLPPHGGRARGCELLVSASLQRSVRISRLEVAPGSGGEPRHGRLERVLQLHTQAVTALQALPAGSCGAEDDSEEMLLATGSHDRLVILWPQCALEGTMRDGHPRWRVLRGHTKSVSCLALLPRNRFHGCSSAGLLASGAWDRTIRIWRLTARKARGQHGCTDTAGGSDVETDSLGVEEALCTLTGHSAPVSTLACVDCGGGAVPGGYDHVLVSGSYDGTIRLWANSVSSDPRSHALRFEALHTLHAHPRAQLTAFAQPPPLSCGRALPTSKTAASQLLLASGATDGSIALWDLTPLLCDTKAEPSVAVRWRWGAHSLVRTQGQHAVRKPVAVRCLAWPKSGQLLSGADEETIALWHIDAASYCA